MEFISGTILKYIRGKEIIDGTDDVVEFYKYGIEITLSSILNIIIIFLLSLIFNAMSEGIIFLIVFIPTRQFTGGFHADSYLKCNIFFGISYLATLFIFKSTYMISNHYMDLLLLIIELVLVSVICPIRNVHKPIDEKKQYVRGKIVSILLYLIFGLLGLVLVFNNNIYGSMVLYSLHLIAVLGIFGLLKERRRHNEKAKYNSKSNC